MGRSAVQDFRAREEVLAWAETHGWQVGWRNGRAPEPLPGSSMALYGYGMASAERWVWRKMLDLRNPAARRDREVPLPPYWPTAGAPILDDAIRVRLQPTAGASSPAGHGMKRGPNANGVRPTKWQACKRWLFRGPDLEALMRVRWPNLLRGREPGWMAVVDGDRVLALFDWKNVVQWMTVVPRHHGSSSWAVARQTTEPRFTNCPPSPCPPFHWPQDVWTNRDEAVQWFGPVPDGVRVAVAHGGPCVAVMASPTAITIISEEPADQLHPVQGFQRWLDFSTAILANAQPKR